MIPIPFITEWKAFAPWKYENMVEQDLIINRALVTIFSHPVLSARLAFRGGTALHKIRLAPPSRYSEDIDLVQMVPGPIGSIFDSVREVLMPFLGKPQRKQGPGVVNMIFRMQSESPPVTPLRLKVEINSREHFSVLGLEKSLFKVESRWFNGHCEIPIFRLEELLGTKLRALYQRRKGRDLFDLWLGLTQGHAEPMQIVQCFHRYMSASGLRVTAREYLSNMESKMLNPEFLQDADELLRDGIAYSHLEAYELLKRDVLSHLDDVGQSVRQKPSQNK